MTELNQIYKCNVCGNIVEIVHAGIGQLVCCNQEMELLSPKKEDTGQEKHLPIIKKSETEIIVEIGSIPHPMDQDHYIEFIELITDKKTYRKFLKAGDKAIVIFKIKADNVKARAYCNIHGLWEAVE